MTEDPNETGRPLVVIDGRGGGGSGFVSGQASVDDEGNIVSGSFEEEMRRAMGNVEAVLASMDLTLSDVVRVTG